jgi:hypothetical protein
MSKATKKDLSSALLSMTYTELVAVAAGLSELVRKRNAVESKEDFAAVLHDWAQAQ